MNIVFTRGPYCVGTCTRAQLDISMSSAVASIAFARRERRRCHGAEFARISCSLAMDRVTFFPLPCGRARHSATGCGHRAEVDGVETVGATLYFYGWHCAQKPRAFRAVFFSRSGARARMKRIFFRFSVFESFRPI